MIVILYILLGSVTGFFAGMLGVGGGLIIVPGLAMIFKYYYGYTGLYMHFAAGTSLAIMIFTAISSVRKNSAQKRIIWPIVWRILPWIIMGEILGAFIADSLNAFVLSMIFGVITLLLAIKMVIFLFNSKHKNIDGNKTSINKVVSNIMGTIIGLKSGLLGLGGGIISVPFLNSCGISMKKATGTSSALTLPISIIGTICFIFLGIHPYHHIAFAVGYVYWPAALVIIPCTMFFAPIGCTLSYMMPTKWLRIILIIFLIFVTYKMLILPLFSVLR